MELHSRRLKDDHFPSSSAKIKKKRSHTLIMVHVFIVFLLCKSIKYVASNDPTGKKRSY